MLWWPRTQASGDLEVWKEDQTAKGFTQSPLQKAGCLHRRLFVHCSLSQWSMAFGLSSFCGVYIVIYIAYVKEQPRDSRSESPNLNRHCLGAPSPAVTWPSMSQYSITTRQTKDRLLHMLAPRAKEKNKARKERVKWIAPVRYATVS